MTLPNTVPELVEMLNEKYPNRCILPSETLLEAQRYGGSRDVVEFLNTALRLTQGRQTKDIESIL